jgi:hypothetical protein
MWGIAGETGFGPRPKLLSFHMSGLATGPYMPNRHGEGQEKIYYIAQYTLWE